MGAIDKDNAKAIWDWAIGLDNYVTQAFALAVTGIGALFFAYGQILNTHLRVVISLTGLGASLVLVYFTNTAWKDRDGAFRLLRKDPVAVELMSLYDDAKRWRNRGAWKWAYFPVAGTILAFSAILAMAWFLILVSNLGYSVYGKSVIPWAVSEWVVTAFVILVVVLLVRQRFLAYRGATPSLRRVP